jgi:hypothetical protein
MGKDIRRGSIALAQVGKYSIEQTADEIIELNMILEPFPI